MYTSTIKWWPSKIAERIQRNLPAGANHPTFVPGRRRRACSSARCDLGLNFRKKNLLVDPNHKMSEDRSGRHGRASRNWTGHGHGDVSSEPINVMAPTSVVFILSAVLHVVLSSAIRIICLMAMIGQIMPMNSRAWRLSIYLCCNRRTFGTLSL